MNRCWSHSSVISHKNAIIFQKSKMVDGGVVENSSAWKEVRLKESTKLCNNY